MNMDYINQVAPEHDKNWIGCSDAELINACDGSPGSGCLRCTLLKAASVAPAEMVSRKAYICKGCTVVYADEPVTRCDCMPTKQEWIEGTILYQSASAAPVDQPPLHGERAVFEEWSTDFHSEIPDFVRKYPEQSSSEWSGWVARARLAHRSTAASAGDLQSQYSLRLCALLAAWSARAASAHPSDAMLINKHIRELKEAYFYDTPASTKGTGGQ